MNKKGFTLIEVLVSLSLVTLISIFLFQIIFIIRDIYVEKSVKSELYIETSNISNMINKEIINNENEGITLKEVRKVNNNQLYFVFSDNTKKYIDIDRNNNEISYGNVETKILPNTTIGNISLYYNYLDNGLDQNGVFVVRIPISYKNYNNDFSIRIISRYNSSSTLVMG